MIGFLERVASNEFVIGFIFLKDIDGVEESKWG